MSQCKQSLGITSHKSKGCWTNYVTVEEYVIRKKKSAKTSKTLYPQSSVKYFNNYSIRYSLKLFQCLQSHNILHWMLMFPSIWSPMMHFISCLKLFIY
jgi:hypothetical protein